MGFLFSKPTVYNDPIERAVAKKNESIKPLHGHPISTRLPNLMKNNCNNTNLSASTGISAGTGDETTISPPKPDRYGKI